MDRLGIIMPKITAGVGAVLALAIVLSGCSSPGPASENTEQTAPVEEQSTQTTDPDFSFDGAPAAGIEVAGTGYTFHAPDGWKIPDAPEGYTPDALAGDPNDTDGFADNVNVIVSPAGMLTPDQIEQGSGDELSSAGADEVVVNDRVRVAGSETTHISTQLTQQGITYWIEQYGISSDDQTYVVTFSFSETVSDADRQGLAESVLATWAWA